MTTRITLLTQEDCGLCEHAKQVLARVSSDYPVTVEEVNLRTDHGRRLAEKAGVMFPPGVLVDDLPFGYGRLSERKLRKTLAARPQPKET